MANSVIASLQESISTVQSGVDELSQLYEQLSQEIKLRDWINELRDKQNKLDVKILKDQAKNIQIDWPMRAVYDAIGALTIQHDDLNFFVKAESATSITVNGGNWNRNGNNVAMDCDSGEIYATLTGFSSASTTYYVYLELSRYTGLYDGSLAPDKLTAIKSTTYPPSSAILANHKLLATVYVNSSGEIDNNGIIQKWYGGDIYDWYLKPDADITSPGTWLTKTLEVNSQNSIQAYGSDDVALAESTDWKEHIYTSKYGTPTISPVGFFSLKKSGTYTGSAQWTPVDCQSEYATAGESIDVVNNVIQIHEMTSAPLPFDTAWSFCLRTTTSGVVHWATYSTFYSELTSDLIGDGSFTGSIGDALNLAHDIQHYNLESTTNGTGGTARDFADGGGALNTQHDKRYSPRYDAGEGGYDLKNYRTQGAWDMSELHVNATWRSTDPQYWTAANVLMDVTSSIVLKADASSTWEFAALTIHAVPSNTNALTIGDSTHSWKGMNFYSTDLINWDCSCNFDVTPTTTATYDFLLGDSTHTWANMTMWIDAVKINNNTCQSIANVFEKGLFIGTASLKYIGDVGPGDRVLVF